MLRCRVLTDFHLIAVELGTEEQMLARAVDSLEQVGAGETAFLQEALGWTPLGSGRAFARLIALAQARDINIVTSLNIGPDLHEDLPGRDDELRYHAVAIFTRHGVVHVPQAKVTPHSFESADEDSGVTAYERINRVRLDWQDELIETRFVLGSDLSLLMSLSPAQLRCDLLVVLGCLPYGAEKTASRLLERALQAGVARTVFFVNGFQATTPERPQPLALKVEDVLDATQLVTADETWGNRRALRSAFHVYPDEDVADFVSLCALPRRGRIPVPRSRWELEVATGEYPITVSL